MPDESVAKFYRAMGRGYQARINHILCTSALCTYPLCKIGEVRGTWVMIETHGQGQGAARARMAQRGPAMHP